MMLNHLKILNSQKLSCLLGFFSFKSFRGFVSPSQLEDVSDCLSSVLFCIIVIFFIWPTAVHTLEKHQYASAITHKKI